MSNKKLFSFEDNDFDSIDNSDLLINKLIKYSKLKEKSNPVSVTADIIKQRDKIKEELKDKFKSEDSNKIEEDNNNQENTEDNQNSQDNQNTDNTNNNDNQNDNNNQDNEQNNQVNENSENNKDANNDKEKNDKSNTQISSDDDELEVADDKDKLKSIIGSGNKNNTTSNDKPKEKNKDEANLDLESISINNIKNIIYPINTLLEKYHTTVRQYTNRKTLSLENLPIAYTKDAIIKTLNNIISLSNKYRDDVVKYTEKRKEGIKSINDSVTVIKLAYDNKKIHLNLKVITDKDLLSTIVIDIDSDILKSIRVMDKFNKDSNNVIKSIINNTIKELSSVLSSNNYEFSQEDGTYIYNEKLPGFINVHFNNYKYKDYTSVQIDKATCYRIKVIKQNTIASINSIEISKDQDLNKIITFLNTSVVDMSIFLDNAITFINTLNELTNNAKQIVYDLEKGSITNFTEIKIDDILDTIIRVKLSIDFLKLVIDTNIEFISSIVAFTGLITEIDE